MKHIQKMSTYYRYSVPIAGTLISIILLMYFIGYKGYSGWNVLLYCLQPLIISAIVAIYNWIIFFKRKDKNK